MTIAYYLLYWRWPHKVGFSPQSSGAFWDHPLCLSLVGLIEWYSVVVWNLSLDVLILGLWEGIQCRPRSAAALPTWGYLVGAIKWFLDACDESGSPRKRPHCELRSVVTGSLLVAVYQKVQGTPKLASICWFLIRFSCWKYVRWFVSLVKQSQGFTRVRQVVFMRLMQIQISSQFWVWSHSAEGSGYTEASHCLPGTWGSLRDFFFFLRKAVALSMNSKLLLKEPLVVCE